MLIALKAGFSPPACPLTAGGVQNRTVPELQIEANYWLHQDGWLAIQLENPHLNSVCELCARFPRILRFREAQI